MYMYQAGKCLDTMYLCSWASQITQWWRIHLQSKKPQVGLILGWEDLVEEGMTVYFSILAWEKPWTGEPGGYSPLGHEESDTTNSSNESMHT